MAWISQLKKKGETSTDEEAVPSEEIVKERAPIPPGIDAPQLAIMAPDIGGISSFRLRFFDDTATAATFVEGLDPEARRSTHAFWALQDEPEVAADAHSEALVLIRANLTSNIVYVVSFVDLESAWSFARFEVKRGLDLSHLLIYWAAFAQVREELNTVTIAPARPPSTRSQRQTTAGRQAARAIDRYIESPPEASVVATPADSERERRAAAETVRREAEAQAAEAQAQRLAELARQAESEAAERAEAARRAKEERQAEEERNKAILAAARKAEEERLLSEAEAVRDAETERLQVRAEAARLAEEARLQTEAAAERKAEAERIKAEAAAARRIEEERAQTEHGARLQADGDRLAFAEPEPVTQNQPITSESAVELTPPEPVTSVPGDEESTGDSDTESDGHPAAAGTIFTHAPAPEIDDTAAAETADQQRKKRRTRKDRIKDPTSEFPEEPSLSDFDIAYEVERLLSNRRWDKRDEPFSGFRSPPGKF